MLWLWHRLAAVSPIEPLNRELPYSADMAIKRKREEGRKEERKKERERKKEKEREKEREFPSWLSD